MNQILAQNILPCNSWDNIGLHTNPGNSFVSLAVKGMIRIANEDSNCMPILICNSDHAFDYHAHKRSPKVGMQTYCPNYHHLQKFKTTFKTKQKRDI